jgi:hypothetical protein
MLVNNMPLVSQVNPALENPDRHAMLLHFDHQQSDALLP